MNDQTNAQRLYSWGRSRFEGQPARVAWAGSVLRAASQSFGGFPEVDDALLLADTEERWPQAREVFDRLRRRSLEQDLPLNEEQALLFTLAELVAKVAHNASGARPPFDHDSGWRIGPIAYRLASGTDDPQLRAELTTALGGEPADS
ncbi:hypothetical protein [Streptomyces sp. MMG1121]|uniref:hypothetical protein n=1 Tax=Streptomyces sp. MMG1121 TaxID=1415544 RepID=UPI00099BBFE3|nr:hypothetical protein [Streptomyces sp. MMG1121]